MQNKGGTKMKILGKNSLTSKVEIGLKAIFIIILGLTLGALLIGGTSLFLEYSSASMIEHHLARLILITIIMLVIVLTGVVALFIIYQFITIFKNLKEEKLFEKENTEHINKIANLSLIIGSLYTIVLIGIAIMLKHYVTVELLSNIVIKILIFILAIAFIVFGIGMKVLNEIYKKAIEYKEENELTI